MNGCGPSKMRESGGAYTRLMAAVTVYPMDVPNILMYCSIDKC